MNTLKTAALTVLITLLAGCTSSPKVTTVARNHYLITSESEFDYTGLIEASHEKAYAFCSDQGKAVNIFHTENGYTNVGWFGPKRMYSVQFTCRHW